jgi:hypothetical protein
VSRSRRTSTSTESSTAASPQGVRPRQGLAHLADRRQQQSSRLASYAKLLSLREHADEGRPPLGMKALVEHRAPALLPGQVRAQADDLVVEQREARIRVVVGVVPAQLPATECAEATPRMDHAGRLDATTGTTPCRPACCAPPVSGPGEQGAGAPDAERGRRGASARTPRARPSRRGGRRRGQRRS